MTNKSSTEDRFDDWDGGGAELQLSDIGDSLGLAIRLTGTSIDMEVGVRIRPEDLDRLERRIREIRQARGI